VPRYISLTEFRLKYDHFKLDNGARMNACVLVLYSNAILTREVHMTSRRLIFIQLSQLTRWPLYVSPFFSSTN